MDEIWYGLYATGDYPKIVQLPTINTNIAAEQKLTSIVFAPM
jgi:hypothetical protein